VVHAIHTTSRLLLAKCGGCASPKPRGFIALELIPCGAYLPYLGKIVTQAAYARFRAALKTELSHEYATEGPRLDDGATCTVLLGQYGTAALRACAHFINCAKGLARANAAWGWKKVDAHFLATYPSVDAAAVRAFGAAYPGMRVTKKTGVLAGEELLVDGYGPDFWQRKKHEEDGTVHVLRPNVLNPRLLALLSDDEEAPRRGLKRAREL
jgi:hypothetical protein